MTAHGRGAAVRAALAAAGLAGAAVAARFLAGRLRARRAVPAELWHPSLLLPMDVTSRAVLGLVRRLPGRSAPPVSGIDVRRVGIPRPGPGEGHVGVFVYADPARSRPNGALLWIHGGGFVMGRAAGYHEMCSRFARELGIVVVGVDYRLAPEHPFPAGLDDCYSALHWLHDDAAELGVDPARIAVGGDSAGGGLAAALAQLAHDRADVDVRFQLLVYPMLDDRTALRADHAGTGAFMWSPHSNRFGWTSYLGHPPRAHEDQAYAVPARRHDLGGLPPAWIGVGDVDLFHAEDVEYAGRLRAAGVPCDLLVVPGMYHAADAIVPAAPAMVEFRNALTAALAAGIRAG